MLPPMDRMCAKDALSGLTLHLRALPGAWNAPPVGPRNFEVQNLRLTATAQKALIIHQLQEGAKHVPKACIVLLHRISALGLRFEVASR
mmetsp:Transcript_76293/g.143754  ORF Transcript_76293/g.143754 Transcript_76293/m.143754 type:complete len:89 (-) Transcript_76293:47-313(-)